MNKSRSRSLTLRLVHFKSGGRDYAIQLSFVKEIIRCVALRRVPELPDFVAGVMNLRGQVIPVIDFQRRAGMGTTDLSLHTRFMILRIKALLIGVIVDEVREVVTVQDKDVSQNIHADVVVDPKYISGSFVLGDRMVIVVNAQKLFTANEFIQMDKGLSNA